MNIQTSNLCRECIREFFPTRKCFVFDRPTNDKKLLADIENASENQLNPKFQEQTKKFCSYIFTNAKTETLREGVLVTGNCLFSYSYEQQYTADILYNVFFSISVGLYMEFWAYGHSHSMKKLCMFYNSLIWGIINLSHKLQILSLISVTSTYLKNFSIQNKNHCLSIKTEYAIFSGEALYNKSSLQGENKKYFESFVWFKNQYQPINL